MAANNKIIFGVCAWLALKFDINVTIIRMAFVIFGLFIGSGIMLYMVLYLLKILLKE